MSQVFASLGQSADRKLEELAHNSREKLEQIKGKRLGELAHDTKGWVKDNPGKTIVGAAAMGILVGWLIGRR